MFLQIIFCCCVCLLISPEVICFSSQYLTHRSTAISRFHYIKCHSTSVIVAENLNELSGKNSYMTIEGSFLNALINQMNQISSSDIHSSGDISFFVLYILSLIGTYHGIQWASERSLLNKIIQLLAEYPQDEVRIKELQLKRYQLLTGGHQLRHLGIGTLLLLGGTYLSSQGGWTTWQKATESFPGEHLLAGVTVTLFWALATGLLPVIGKGEDWAADRYIFLNTVAFVILSWELASGLGFVHI